MKKLSLIPFLFFAVTAFGQDKIAEVEKNLTGTIQVTGERPFTIQERMAYYNLKGVSVAVIQNYKLAWAKGYGWADDSLKVPVTPQTLFQAASISKSFNGLGVLKLAQDQKLDLYKDINTYLTTWQFPYDSLSGGKKITTADLLSHTAGLTVHGFGGYKPGSQLPTVVQILNGTPPANSAPVRSMYAPGIRAEYSGGGITISQLIVTDITHQNYADYMQKTVLQPLGMTLSTFALPPLQRKVTLASGYNDQGKRKDGRYHLYPEMAAASLWTNPTDLSRYIIETQLAYEGKSARVLNQNYTRLRLTPYHNKQYGLGVVLLTTDSTSYFSHSGGNEGFTSVYYGSLKGGNGVVVMVNSDNSNIISEIVNSVAKVYGFKGLYFSKVKNRITLPASAIQSFIGKYQLSKDFIITVTEESSQLYAQAPGQGKLLFIPASPSRFFTTGSPLEIEFKKDAAGKIIAMTIYNNGHLQEAKKIE